MKVMMDGWKDDVMVGNEQHHLVPRVQQRRLRCETTSLAGHSAQYLDQQDSRRSLGQSPFSFWLGPTPMNSARSGTWEPLPLIVYGYAIHPLSPSRRDTIKSNRTTRLSTVTESSTDSRLLHRDIVNLEVGDEVYAFEKYTPRNKEVEGVWYRGYVVCTTHRLPTAPTQSAESSAYRTPIKTEDAQRVFIGIFPASHIHVRDELPDAEGRMTEVVLPTPSAVSDDTYGRLRPGRDPETETMSTQKSFKGALSLDQSNFTGGKLLTYPPSTRSPSPVDDIQAGKPVPPRPSLRSGDDTASSISQPIIDEIASALREWYSLMFHYLARRDYKLFRTVRDYIETLHLERRQLLAQTLSVEETNNLRRDCVNRLVLGNVVQGLDIIVRHPTWGGLVTVEMEGEIDRRNWLSAVRMYALQASLAFNAVPDSIAKYTLASRHSEFALHPSSSSNGQVSTPTPSSSVFPNASPLSSRHKRSVGSVGTAILEKPAAVKFYHVFVELRAFVASPCAPGETVELFFSLYNRARSRFITEDSCLILNHRGVLAREPTGRMRMFFTDLTHMDVIQDPTYLVCRIVRNGALRNNASATGQVESPDGKNASTAAAATSPTYKTLMGGDSAHVRRPFGAAVLELTSLGKYLDDNTDTTPMKEFTMPIFVSVQEGHFATLHEDIIGRNTKDFEKSSRAEGLALSVKIFRGSGRTIMQENMSLLQDVPPTLRLSFPDVVFPGEQRNELYIKLWSGEFMGSSAGGGGGRLSVMNLARGQVGSASMNVEVVMEVRDEHGALIENVISQGSGEPLMSRFHSMVFQRNSEPTFGELIKLMLPNKENFRWHLFFTFRNRSAREKGGGRSVGGGGGANGAPETVDKPFAFAFLPLFSNNRNILDDGSYTMVLYKADRLAQLNAEMYLAATSVSPESMRLDEIKVPPDMLKLAYPLRDSFTIRSSLCSAKYTQNPVLFSLLHWESLKDPEILSLTLAKFVFLEEIEIIKFLRDIFDSLFGILVSPMNQSGDINLLVFKALVNILRIVQDRRFSNFLPVLDVYIERHFRSANCSTLIIKAMNQLLKDPSSNETAANLRQSLKVWYYIFKFVARSRELQKAQELKMAGGNGNGGVTIEHLESTFKRELKTHFHEVNSMMSASLPASIIGTQSITLQNFASILPELAKIYPLPDIVETVRTFASVIPPNQKGQIVIWKLMMYLQVVKSFLFEDPESRSALVEAAVMWIKPHLGKYNENMYALSSDNDTARESARVTWLECNRICVTIVAVMLDKIQEKLMDPEIQGSRNWYRKEQINVELILQVLPRLLETYQGFQDPISLRAIDKIRTPISNSSSAPTVFPESYPFSLIAHLPQAYTNVNVSVTSIDRPIFNPGLGETAATLIALILVASNKHLLGLLEDSLEIEGREALTNLLRSLFKVMASILDNDAFPNTWLNIGILSHKVLLKMMDPICSILERDFIPDRISSGEFNTGLWTDCFVMLLKLLSSDQLVIEEFSPQKRRAVWRLAGDIRGDGAVILLRLWDALATPAGGSIFLEGTIRSGGYQRYFKPLASHIVNLCLSRHEQLRSNAVQILCSMIVTDYNEMGNFEDIENQLVNKLDSLFMSDSKGDEISRAFFISQLRSLFESPGGDEKLQEGVATFLDSVDLFLELLLNVRALPEGDEYLDDRVIATLRLMNFIRRIGRDEIYIKYVHQLVNMHLQSHNYVEAALSLKLHSDLYEWDLHSFVGPMPDLGLPQQSQFHRKETISLLILDYLGKGKAWESAVEICKVLAIQHSEVTFNYARLSEILRHQALLLEHIATDQRYYPDYFRVAFYGNFPAALRNKQFIYRGYEWEKFGAFCERMLSKHPGARLLETTGDVPVDIRFGSDQYIQCAPVAPEPDRKLPLFVNPDVPANVRSYYEHSAVNVFSSTRAFTKGDSEDEIWHEKSLYTTEETFPTVLRRSEIIQIDAVEISPIEIAHQDVETRTKELAALDTKYSALARTGQVVPTNALSMALNSAVDSPYEEGIPAYRQIFFDEEYVMRNPGHYDALEKLRLSIDEHVKTIKQCLRLHKQLCSTEWLKFHETLENFFQKNFQEEIYRLGLNRLSDSPLITSQDLPPMIPSSSTSTLHAINLGERFMHLPSVATAKPGSVLNGAMTGKPTLLQRHLQHLATHGIGGVSSGPIDDRGDGDSISTSPQESYNNNGASANGHGVTNGISGAGVSGASLNTSNIGSIKGRLSRFGTLNFKRQ